MFQYEDLLLRYRNSHYQDEMIVRPYHSYNGKTALLWHDRFPSKHSQLSIPELDYEDQVMTQCSGLSWKCCRSWSEFWEIKTSFCKEMCKKLLVLTKSCWSRTDGPALVSNTVMTCMRYLVSSKSNLCTSTSLITAVLYAILYCLGLC